MAVGERRPVDAKERWFAYCQQLMDEGVAPDELSPEQVLHRRALIADFLTEARTEGANPAGFRAATLEDLAEVVKPAGLRISRRCRESGYRVGLYDGEEAGMDTEAGRWQTVCEWHHTICCHETYELALWYLSPPYPKNGARTASPKRRRPSSTPRWSRSEWTRSTTRTRLRSRRSARTQSLSLMVGFPTAGSPSEGASALGPLLVLLV